tara:strand:+ start:529 stop:762 length:234 start_codon:yes stop_codon:yes gene_type:complete
MMFPKNNIVIKGTPLIHSIKITEMDFITGIFDLLPRAKRILKGKATIIPVSPRKRVTRSPPHLEVDISVNPGPPYKR